MVAAVTGFKNRSNRIAFRQARRAPIAISPCARQNDNSRVVLLIHLPGGLPYQKVKDVRRKI